MASRERSELRILFRAQLSGHYRSRNSPEFPAFRFSPHLEDQESPNQNDSRREDGPVHSEFPAGAGIGRYSSGLGEEKRATRRGIDAKCPDDFYVIGFSECNEFFRS